MKGTRWGVAALVAGFVLSSGQAVVPAANAGERKVNRAAPDTDAADAAGLSRFHWQRINWHRCQQGPQDTEGQALDQAGAQCADITVPLDYTRPDERTITVAISRLRATSAAERIGPMIINLGGPAIPALATVPLARQAMGETGGRFDLIGMDRRFVGRSAPLDCGWSSGWLPRSAGTDRESFNRMVRLASDLARRCARQHGDVLPYASTANTARDMDVIRAALGASKLSYLGYSQGTYLGAVYTQLFPHRAGRMVLDSALDPARPGTGVMRDGGPVREAALRDWAAWAARRDNQYHLGSTAGRVISTVGRIYQAAARRPLRVGRYDVDDTVMPALLVDPLSDDGDDSNAELAATLQVLAKAATSGTAAPTPELDSALAGLLTGANSPGQSANAAILCADAVVPRDPRWYWRDIQAHRASAPLFGPLSRNIRPCAFWPTGPQEAPVAVHNHVPALIVNAAGDINALLDMGQAMHRALSGSRMITLENVRTHGVYLFRGAACVDDTVDAYLNSGNLPTQDFACARPANR